MRWNWLPALVNRVVNQAVKDYKRLSNRPWSMHDIQQGDWANTKKKLLRIGMYPHWKRKRIRYPSLRSGPRVYPRKSRVKRRKFFRVQSSSFRPAHKSEIRKAEFWNIRKSIGSGVWVANENECSYNYALIGVKSDLENFESFTRMDASSIQNSINISTLNNAKILVRAILTLEIKNNTGLPIQVDVYRIMYNTNIAANPQQLVETGLDDYTEGLLNPELNVQYNAYHAKRLQRLIKILSRRKIMLQPGEHMSLKMKMPVFVFDPQVNDRISLDYLSGITRGFLIRQQGTIAHQDGSTSTVGYSESTLDYIEKKEYYFAHLSEDRVKLVQQSGSLPALTVAEGANFEGDAQADDPK